MAYLGTDDGAIYRFSEGTGFDLIDTNATSTIRAIVCHGGTNACLIITESDGLGVIGQECGWLGSRYSQRAMVRCICAHTLHPTCVAFGSGKRTTMVELDEDVASRSRRGPVYIIDEAEGMFIGASVGSEDLTLVRTAPMGLHIHRFREHAVYPHVAPSAFIEGARHCLCRDRHRNMGWHRCRCAHPDGGGRGPPASGSHGGHR